MFTGIIEDKGKVLRAEYRGRGKRLSLGFSSQLTDVQLGDSININGVCLTVADKREEALIFDLSEETIKKSDLGELKEGDRVNFERALRLTDRLGGHIVTGHIDGVGTIVEKRKEGDFLNLKIRIPRSVMRYVAPKGSIAIDGVSLTVNELKEEEIRITLIPFTLEKTNLTDKKAGDHVNVESDILGKYVGQLLNQKGEKSEGLDLTFLKEHGWIEGE